MEACAGCLHGGEPSSGSDSVVLSTIYQSTFLCCVFADEKNEIARYLGKGQSSLI